MITPMDDTQKLHFNTGINSEPIDENGEKIHQHFLKTAKNFKDLYFKRSASLRPGTSAAAHAFASTRPFTSANVTQTFSTNHRLSDQMIKQRV